VVASYEIDARNRALLRTITNYLQEAAVRHAIELGVARGQLGEGRTWMLSRLRVEMEAWPRWRDAVTVETWPSGIERLFALRDFRIGPRWGVATSAWMVVDTRRRRPVRVPESVKALRPEDPERVLEAFGELPPEGPDEPAERTMEFPVRWSDCDVNGHANQASYVGWMTDVLPDEFLRAHEPRSFEIEFRAEARPGDVVVSAARGGMHVLRRRGDGMELARASLRWAETAPSPSSPSSP
jgi:acyl-ACP thioesterase